MPIHENNVLDDPIVYDGDMAFAGWQPNRAPRLLGEGQLALLENGEIDDLGRVIGRRGRTASALRTVVGALAGGQKVRVDIVDTDRLR